VGDGCPCPPTTTLPRDDHPCDRRRRPCSRQGWPWAATTCGRPTVGPLYEHHTAIECARGRLPPLRAAAPTSGADLPYGLALVATGHPLARGLVVGGGPAWGLAMAGHPSSLSKT
ncbi:hypothetical protein B296_00044801, partial [Ensete ventricosum]